MNKKKNISQKARVLTLAWVYMTAFLLPYLQYNFYEPLRVGLGASHEQLGTLISMYGIICLVTYVPGGWIADRLSLKKIMISAMVINALLCTLLFFSFTWSVALMVWALCAFTSGGAFWAALIKGVGLSGSSEEQGKIWGIYEFGDAFLGLIVSYINLWLLSKFAETLGIRAVFMSIAVISVIATVLLVIFFEDTKVEGNVVEEKATFKEVIGVFKLPVIWFLAIVIMCNYVVYAGMTYFTPYLTDVLGFGVVAGTSLVVLRSYGVRMVAGPTFGRLADKKGSPIKAITVGMILTAILIGVFLLLPTNTMPVILILIFFLATFSLLGARGIAFATLDEAKIPNNLRGLAVAIVSMVAYTPDLFIYNIFGGIIDKNGAEGYRIIFTTLIVISVITVAFAWLAITYNKKSKENN